MAANITTAQVISAFETISNPCRGEGGSLSEVMDTIEAYSDPNIVFHVIGQEFPLACHVTGFQAMKNQVLSQMAPAFLSALDTTANSHQRVVQVIGGVDDKVVIQFEGKGVTKAGKILVPHLSR